MGGWVGGFVARLSACLAGFAECTLVWSAPSSLGLTSHSCMCSPPDWRPGHLPPCLTLPADILQLVGLKSFRVAGVLLMGLLAYGEWEAWCCPWHPYLSWCAAAAAAGAAAAAACCLPQEGRHLAFRVISLPAPPPPPTHPPADVFWVFGSPSVVGENVMLQVATSGAPVVLLYCRTLLPMLAASLC